MRASSRFQAGALFINNILSAAKYHGARCARASKCGAVGAMARALAAHPDDAALCGHASAPPPQKKQDLGI